MKSMLKAKAPLLKQPAYDFGFGSKIIYVRKLPITSDEYKKKLNEMVQQGTEQKKAEALIQSKVIEVEAFNQIMEHISSLFDFKIEPSELKEQMEVVRKLPMLNSIPEENKQQFIESFAKKTVMKSLIFAFFVQRYNHLSITAAEAETLMKANGMLDKLDSVQKPIAIKNFQQNVAENKVIDWLIRQYKIVVDFKPVKK